MSPKWFNWVQIFQKDPICSKRLQMSLNGPASDPNCSNCSKWVPRGPKYGSNIIMNSIGWPLNPGLLGLVLFQEEMQEVYFNFAIIGLFYEYTRSLDDTCQLVFCNYMHNNFVGEEFTPFFNCVITVQYVQYIL